METRATQKEPTFLLRMLRYFIYVLLLAGIFVIVHIGLLQSLKIRTGFDAGLGFQPLVEFQEAWHHEVDPVGLLLSYGYPTGKYVLQGEDAVAGIGNLIIGDVLLLNNDDTVLLSLYDKDFWMDTCTMIWVDKPCKIKAAVNPAYILYDISDKDILKIVGIIESVYNYKSVGVKHFSTGENVLN